MEQDRNGTTRVSYPTKSLRFLSGLKTTNDGMTETPQSRIRLKVIIAGAGLGGLATAVALARTGHSVRVFERAPILAEVGAGIQIPPNSSRLLRKWGLEAFVATQVVEPESITLRRWENGKPIAYTKLVPSFRDTFDAPYWVIHRAHFHGALCDLAKSLGVEVLLGSSITSYDPETPSLSLEDGSVHYADIIIGADGLMSLARTAILGTDDEKSYAPGFAAYRATVDVRQIKANPDTAWLVEKPSLNLWIGDMRHVMTYMISGGKTFNMVLSHPESTPPHSWSKSTVLPDMMKHFDGWDSRLLSVMKMITSTVKWPLMSGKPLKRWVASSGRMLIMGDAAHAMVPYMSQGAAMAVEDGAALAAILASLDDQCQLSKALAVFERVRNVRASQMQEASLVNGKLWHFPDGREQQARDRAAEPEVNGEHFLVSSNQWSDPATQIWCYGYDAEEAILEAWAAECNSRPSVQRKAQL